MGWKKKGGDSGVQDMYKQSQVASEVSMTSGAVNGIGPNIFKCYRGSTRSAVRESNHE